MRATDASKKALYFAPRRPINPLISPEKCALPATPHPGFRTLRPIEAAARQIAWPFPGLWPQGQPLSGPRLHASGVDLTFAPHLAANSLANVKSKTPLETYVC